MVAVTRTGPVLVHPDKSAKSAFAKAAQKVFQDPALQPLWRMTLDVCHQHDTSLYSPAFDAFFINISHAKTNGGIPLEMVLRHELGHALDDLDLDKPLRRRLPYEMTADAFAVLHHLRERPGDMLHVMYLAGHRAHDCGHLRHHPFNTLAAIDAAIIYARENDLSQMHITQLATVARDISNRVCPQVIYERDARGRFLRNPFR